MKFGIHNLVVAAVVAGSALVGCSSQDNDVESSSEAVTAESPLSGADCKLVSGPANATYIDPLFPYVVTETTTVIGEGPGCAAKCEAWLKTFPSTSSLSSASLASGLVTCRGTTRVEMTSPPPGSCRLFDSGSADSDRPAVRQVSDPLVAKGIRAKFYTGVGDQRACAYACDQKRREFLRTTRAAEPSFDPNNLYANFEDSAEHEFGGQYVCSVGRYIY